MKIIKYQEQYKSLWNEFVINAKNSHFFFNREYIEYHKDRFLDFSLMIFDNKDRLISLFPANIENFTLYSHQGLTFGGFLFNDKIKTVKVVEIFEKVKEFLVKNSIKEVYYKVIPYIYYQKPSQEDKYALFLQNATLIKVELSSTIYLDKSIKYSNGRRWSIKKAKKENLYIEEDSKNFDKFWSLLKLVLDTHHNSKPVHSVDEIKQLQNSFPNNIKLYLVYKDKELISGAVVFINTDIVHLQYVANSNIGREIGGLDYLIDFLIKERFKDKKYFDFGTSYERDGSLNKGLIDQKERFGASGVAQELFLWKLQ